MKMSEAVEGYLLLKSSRASATTIKTDGVLLRQFTDWLGDDPNVADIDADTVRRYLAYQRERGLSPHTLRRHHATISTLYAWLASDDIALVTENPARAVPPPKLSSHKIHYLSLAEVSRLLAATHRAFCKRQMRAMVLFLLDIGARASEVAGVRMTDTNLKTGRVRVVGKGNKERHVYLGKRALSALWLYISDERPEPAQADDNHLFLTDDGYPMDRYSILGAIR